MQKMTNTVQNYAWGSHDALTKLYGIANPQENRWRNCGWAHTPKAVLR